MTMLENEAVPVDAAATAVFAHQFQAFAEPARLAIVQHLASGEHRVRDLVVHMGLAQSTVSKHLAFLLECGLVAARVDGRATWYAIKEPALMRSLMSAAERLLSATGNPAQLCLHLRDEQSSATGRSA